MIRILFEKCEISPTLISMLQSENKKFHGEEIWSKKETSFHSSNCTITTWRIELFPQHFRVIQYAGRLH